MNIQPAASATPVQAQPQTQVKPGPQHFPAAAPTDLERHSRKCIICAHPERDAIDQAFLHWRSTINMAHEFDVPRASIYRHVQATGLIARRNGSLRHSLSFIIEQAERCVPSADAIIRAVRAFAHINDDGHWIDQPRQVIVTNRYEPAPVVPATVVVPAAPAPETPAGSALDAEPQPAAPANTKSQNPPNLIVNEKIKNPGQPAQNKLHSEILIVNNSLLSVDSATPTQHPHPTNADRGDAM